MAEKIMTILAQKTGGKSYKAYKYAIDNSDRPSIDYGEDTIVWKKTVKTKQYCMLCLF